MFQRRVLLILVASAAAWLFAVTERARDFSDRTVMYLNGYWTPAVDQTREYLTNAPAVDLYATAEVRGAACPGGTADALCGTSTAGMVDARFDRMEASLDHLQGLLESSPPRRALFVLPRAVDDRAIFERVQSLREHIAQRGLPTTIEIESLGTDGFLNGLDLPMIRLSFPSVVTPHEQTFEGAVEIQGAAGDISIELVELDQSLTTRYWRLEGATLKESSSSVPTPFSQRRGESTSASGTFESPLVGQSKVFVLAIESASTGDVLRTYRHTVTTERPEMAVLIPGSGSSVNPREDPILQFLDRHGLQPVPLALPASDLTDSCESSVAQLAKWPTIIVGGWFGDDYASALVQCLAHMQSNGHALPRLLFVGLPREPGTGRRDMPPGWGRFLNPLGLQPGSERRIVLVADGSASMNDPLCGGKSRLGYARAIAQQLKQGFVESATSGLLSGECRDGCSGTGDSYYSSVFRYYDGSEWEASDHIDRVRARYKADNISDVIAFWMSEDLQKGAPANHLSASANSNFDELAAAGVRFWVIALSNAGLNSGNPRLNQAEQFHLRCGSVDADIQRIKEQLFIKAFPRIAIGAGPDLRPDDARFSPLLPILSDPALRMNNSLLAATPPAAATKTLLQSAHWSGQGAPQPLFVTGSSATSPPIDVGYLGFDVEGEYTKSVVADREQRKALSRLIVTAITSFAVEIERAQVSWRTSPNGRIAVRRTDGKPFQLGVLVQSGDTKVDDAEGKATDSSGDEIEKAHPDFNSLFELVFDFPKARVSGRDFLASATLADHELGVVSFESPFVAFEPELLSSAVASALASGEVPVDAGTAHRDADVASWAHFSVGSWARVLEVLALIGAVLAIFAAS